MPRLSKTAVREAVKRAGGGECVEHIGSAETMADGRREVRMSLLDAFDDPRGESPAVAALISDLESRGWCVRHHKARFRSRLIVAEMPDVVAQYGRRKRAGVVFAYSSRAQAEADDNGTLVAHEGRPGMPETWTEWHEVAD